MMSQATFDRTIGTFYEQLARNPHHRYRSWERCYDFFREHSADLQSVEDTAALHLGFYLASWGMYRGSSFLLQQTYTAHVPVIHALASTQFSTLWERDVGANEEDVHLAPTILALVESIKDTYEPFGKATDTLATKVLLGTIGCLPALDRFFIQGLKSHGFQYSYLNGRFVDRIVRYCIENREALCEQQSLIARRSEVKYPLMKLADMHFWQIGFEMDQAPDVQDAMLGNGAR